MTKMKKVLSIITATCVLFGNVAVCTATSAGITASVTKKRAEASYSYGKGGNQLMVKIHYYEKHSETGQKYNKTKSTTVNGSYTTATVIKYADTGYNFTTIDALGYIRGELKAAIYELTP